ncbi:MAG: SMC-Scp complex subunit ScpB [bacterium]
MLKARIEAFLFVTARAVTVKEIADMLEVDIEEVEPALLDLIMDYSSRDTALEIEDEDGCYILQVREEHMDIVEKLVPVELKPAVLRTLSVIAIKEPLRQSKLIEFRGQSAYDHIGELVEKGLITRKRDTNGRSYVLKTTPKFAEYFKLKGDTQALAKILEVEGKAKD